MAAFGLEVDRAGLLHRLEGARPEFQAQDVALPRQQLIVDVETRHRLQVRVDNGVGDERGETGGGIDAVLDVVQGCRTDLQAVLVALVPLRDAGIEIPAVVIEACRCRDSLRILEGELLELLEADDDIGDLDAGVVNVVLHLDGIAAVLEGSHERVTEGGVTEMTDVRGLVRIDGRVFDNRFLGPRGRRRKRSRQAQAGEEERRSLEEDVEIAVRRGFDPGHAWDRAERGGELLRDRPRRFAQAAGQVERHGRSEITQRAVGRILNRNRQVGVGDAVKPGKSVAHTRPDLFMKRKNHVAGSLTRSKACGTLTLSDPHAFVMVDAGIGRLLISSLHQGIADVSPNRLEFYENWLSPTGMRDGRIGLAPLGAVLSFVHREEAPANDADCRARRPLRRRLDLCRFVRVSPLVYPSSSRPACARGPRSVWASA